MSVIDTTEAPVLAAPRRPEGRVSLRQFLQVIRDNVLATYAPEDFDKDFIARRLLWRRTFVVNEPGGVRHVLLDNAQNYRKSELSRRILEPGLGRGLITTDGELWRRHRRIMAPAFDPRSVAGYAPVMTEVTEEMLAQWDALPEYSVVDVAVAMMHTTLHIISRAMFSSDSDEIVDVVERGVSEYQTTVRPSLLDLLHVPEWLTALISPRMADGILDEFDASVDRLLTERGLTGRDASFATELTYGTLRGRGSYDAILAACSDRDDIDPPVRDVLRLGAHQLLATRVGDHAAVATSVDLAKDVCGPRPSGFVNAVLRRVATRDLDSWIQIVAPDRTLGLSFPCGRCA
jgi:transcription termination factor NusB